MSVDKFLSRKRTKHYDCAAFSRDVWLDVAGVDLAETGLLSVLHVGRLPRVVRQAFRALARPSSPCLVLMRRPRAPLHVGVYLRGSVLHLTDTGVEYAPVAVASRAFKTVQFIATC